MAFYWPLLDIKYALRDADRNLADIVRYVETLHAESGGTYPPGGVQVLHNIAAVREMLGWVLPQELKEAIAHEQAQYDDEDAKHSY